MKNLLSNDKGIALAIAISVSLMVSLLASFVLNITYRRFNLSYFQESRMVSYYAAEGGIQYVYMRLQKDTTFRNNVLADVTPTGSPVYIISSMTTAAAIARGHLASGEVVDEPSVAALQLGSAAKPKQMTIRVRPVGSQFEVRAMTDYGMSS